MGACPVGGIHHAHSRAHSRDWHHAHFTDKEIKDGFAGTGDLGSSPDSLTFQRGDLQISVPQCPPLYSGHHSCPTVSDCHDNEMTMLKSRTRRVARVRHALAIFTGTVPLLGLSSAKGFERWLAFESGWVRGEEERSCQVEGAAWAKVRPSGQRCPVSPCPSPSLSSGSQLSASKCFHLFLAAGWDLFLASLAGVATPPLALLFAVFE